MRSKVSEARALRVLAAKPEFSRADKDEMYAESAFMLLGALAHRAESPDIVHSKEQRKWTRLAVKFLSFIGRTGRGSGDPAVTVAMMTDLYLKLHLYRPALKLCTGEHQLRCWAFDKF